LIVVFVVCCFRISCFICFLFLFFGCLHSFQTYFTLFWFFGFIQRLLLSCF
jgi:hypothetical protein